MAALWFYRPTRIWRKAVSALVGPWSHVGIAHTVADLAVLTEAHPIIGVWCSTLSRTAAADDVVLVDVPDAFTTRWMAERWGVRYGWYHPADLPSQPRPRTHVTSATLAHMFVVDAAAAGYAIPNQQSVISAKNPNVSELYRLLSGKTT